MLGELLKSYGFLGLLFLRGLLESLVCLDDTVFIFGRTAPVLSSGVRFLGKRAVLPCLLVPAFEARERHLQQVGDLALRELLLEVTENPHTERLCLRRQVLPALGKTHARVVALVGEHLVSHAQPEDLGAQVLVFSGPFGTLKDPQDALCRLVACLSRDTEKIRDPGDDP